MIKVKVKKEGLEGLEIAVQRAVRIAKLKQDVAWWQDKLNRSRKESLRSIRAVHLDHARNELKKLEESA